MIGARAVLAAAVVFALAMGALQHGGWWWAWLGVGVLFLKGVRLPFMGPPRVPRANRYIIRQNRIAIRENRKNARRQRRKNRQKAKQNKRNPRFRA